MMTKLEELINGLCPDGVEYFTLEELGIFYGGLTGKSKKDFEKGNAKFITYMNVYSNPALKLDVSDVVTIGENERQNCIQYADILFTGSSETPNDCGMSSVLTEYTDEKLYLNSFSFGYRFNNPDKFDVIYLKHLFRSHMLRKQIVKTANGVTRFNVSKAKMAKVQIPVPPKEVQNEIGKTLDNFTELTAELTAELSARQKQYAFYRDYLLDFSNEDVTKKIPDIDCSNVEYIKLGDIAKFTYGYTDKAKDYGNTRFIRITDILDNGYLNPNDAKYINLNEESKKYLLSKGDLLLARTGATYGKTLYVPNDEKAVYASFLIKIELDNTKILNRYYWHFSKSNLYWKQANKLVSTAGQPQFNTNAVSRIVIPVPPLSVQENIVKILDRFDKLNNDMSEGLPAEIETRKKQYEYYRDTLLSFDDKACSHIVKVERERELTRIKAIKWLELSDIVTIERGKRVVRNDLSQEIGYPVYQNALKPLGYYTDKNRNANSVFVIGAGAAGEIGYSYVDYWAADDCFTFVCDDKLNQRYLYFLLMSKQAYLKNNVRKSSIPRLPRIALENMKIPVPPLEEQERIVSILDRFDKLCNDISEGLPAEIEARQKQYEYYRDKLLTFKMRN